jgi:hypothetical protein
MARNRPKKALYEVIGQGWPKAGAPGKPGPLHPDQGRQKASAGEEVVRVPFVEEEIRLPRKPSLFHWAGGRIEFSLPYSLVTAAALVFVLFLVVAYRAGQNSRVVESVPEQAAGTPQEPTAWMPPEFEPVDSTGSDSPVESPGTAVAAGGSNVIVLVEYDTPGDLGPVQDHFGDYGIETQIVKRGSSYLLITADKYGSMASGSAGDQARRRIVEVGALYRGKAPEGFETFAPHYFSDAYGMKVE